jgi:MFS family permease
LTASGAKRALPRVVIGLGLVSLFTDMSSDAIFPLLPAFLTSLGASNAFIGLIEGAADLVANLLKYVSGALADRRQRLKPIVLVGYGVSTVARPLVTLALSPWHVLGIRIADRVGKGIRTSPRDALLAGATDPSMVSRAFGFHRAMDHAGAALGTLLGMGLLFWLAGGAEQPSSAQFRDIFLWAAVPGVLAMLALALTPEPARETRPGSTPAAMGPLPPAFKRALGPLALFAFANASDAFILVKIARLGAPPMLAPGLWLVLHLIKAATATWGGALADRRGKRNALALGWTVYALSWSLVGAAETLPVLLALIAIYGCSHGLVEGAEKGLVAELGEGAGRGRVFGIYNMLIGFSALVASTTFGLVWDRWGSGWAFGASGGVALLAALTLLVSVPPEPRAPPAS